MKKMIAAPIVLGVVGVAILLYLGAWQFQRLGWKEALIAEIAERVAAEPVALPVSVLEEEHDLLRVEVDGYPETRELHVINSVKQQGAGYRVIIPFEVKPEAGKQPRTIMVDLGFVPESRKDIASRPGGAEVRKRKVLVTKPVTGLLYWPKETDSYTPLPDLDRNIWFARDVELMAHELGTEPVLLVAQMHPEQDWIKPRPPGATLPNRHMEYALTWFGLAIVWAGMSIYWLRVELIRASR